MRRQTVILTLWLVMPFAALGAIMSWVFLTLDSEKLMADAPAVGAGAGDTGNANALGQLLAGRDPDLIDRALKARRAQEAIDPRDWPGGVEIRIDASLLVLGEDASPLVVAQDRSSGARLVSKTLVTSLKIGESVDADDLDPIEWFIAQFERDDIADASIWISDGPVRLVGGQLIASNGDPVESLPISTQIPPPDLAASDPMVIEFVGSQSP